MFYVYVLYSQKLNKHYIGKTTNLKKRFEHHNSGLDRWTSRGTPWILLYYEAYKSKKDIGTRELFLKSGMGRKQLIDQLKYSVVEAKVGSA